MTAEIFAGISGMKGIYIPESTDVLVSVDPPPIMDANSRAASWIVLVLVLFCMFILWFCIRVQG